MRPIRGHETLIRLVLPHAVAAVLTGIINLTVGVRFISTTRAQEERGCHVVYYL